jgi:hypothetical protein
MLSKKIIKSSKKKILKKLKKLKIIKIKTKLKLINAWLSVKKKK